MFQNTTIRQRQNCQKQQEVMQFFIRIVSSTDPNHFPRLSRYPAIPATNPLKKAGHTWWRPKEDNQINIANINTEL
jgi:hypothetical protein